MTMALTAMAPDALAGLTNHPLVERLLKQPAERAWTELVARAPTFASAVAIALVLWLVAKLVRSLAEQAGQLDDVARWTREHLTKETEVFIAAFTDAPLEDMLAERLTQQQAEAVRQYLVASHGLDSAGWFRSRTVAAVGFGRHQPRGPATEPQLDAPGRRVEIILFTPQA